MSKSNSNNRKGNKGNKLSSSDNQKADSQAGGRQKPIKQDVDHRPDETSNEKRKRLLESAIENGESVLDLRPGVTNYNGQDEFLGYTDGKRLEEAVRRTEMFESMQKEFAEIMSSGLGINFVDTSDESNKVNITTVETKSILPQEVVDQLEDRDAVIQAEKDLIKRRLANVANTLEMCSRVADTLFSTPTAQPDNRDTGSEENAPEQPPSTEKKGNNYKHPKTH